MDETAIVEGQVVTDGFAGQRMIVLAPPAAAAAASRPVTRRLLVTDAGFFPEAAYHGRSRPAGAEQNVVLLCTGGNGSVTLPDGHFAVQRGDAVIIPARVPHAYAASSASPWTLWWFHLIGDDAADLVRTARSAAGGPVSHLRDPAPVASLVSQVIDALDAGTAGGLVEASGAAWHALTLVIATGRRATGGSPGPVDRALAHLRATTPRRTSVAELARMVGLSPSQFGALFREQVGMSPLRYQVELRMARARELLDSTERTVAGIAADCAYSDPLYFSRQFTRLHGLSPLAYRRRDW